MSSYISLANPLICLDDDDDVFIVDQVVDECKRVISLCLVWKLLLRKPYNLEAMKIAFAKAWNLSHAVDIREFSERVFIFQFPYVIEQKFFFDNLGHLTRR